MSRTIVRSSRNNDNASSRWLPEGLRQSLATTLTALRGGVVMVLAVAIAISLLSYSASDPSWNTAIGRGNHPVVHNWLGQIGSHTADIILQFLGCGGFLIAVILAAWSWGLATGRGLTRPMWRIVFTVITLFAAATSLSALSILLPNMGLDTAGGAIGALINSLLLPLLPPSFAAVIIISISTIITVITLYMACALQLGEWSNLALIMHRLVVWLSGIAAITLYSFWDFLRSEHARYRSEDLVINNNALTSPPAAPVQDTTDAAVAMGNDNKAPTVRKANKSLFIGSRKSKSITSATPSAASTPDLLGAATEGAYILPPLDFLQWPDNSRTQGTELSEEVLEQNARTLESVLSDFGVYGQILRVNPGPVVTLYELEPRAGTRASRVILLADDVARNMSAVSARIAVVSGHNVIGIELPNRHRETVYLRELLASESYIGHNATLPLALGKDIAGIPVIADLAKMPHLLIAGTTGSGKSVAVNTMILSLLYRLPPSKCRFIMVDPKMLELSVYDGIPHLLTPVVTDPKKAIMALKWTVREMDERYRAMSRLGVRGIEGYNTRLREAERKGEELTRTVQTGFEPETGKPIYEEQKLDLTPLPYIVVIVDEMADLMIVAGKDIESALQRLAQMARAAGIHLVMATQRPSVDVITGTIKANFPTRISFHVTSKIDSRTILGEQGAEQLLGQGDMLYMSVGGRITRVHGPFVRDGEVEAIVRFLKQQGEPEYLADITIGDEEDENDDSGSSGGEDKANGNDLYDKAIDLVQRERKASTSFLQRHLQIGYNRAATLIERMERDGVVSQANHVGKREVLGRKMEE